MAEPLQVLAALVLSALVLAVLALVVEHLQASPAAQLGPSVVAAAYPVATVVVAAF